MQQFVQTFIEEVFSAGFAVQIVVFGSLGVAMLMSLVVFSDKVHEVKKHSTATLLDYVDDKLYEIYEKSVSRLSEHLEQFEDAGETCEVTSSFCGHKQNESMYQLEIAKRILSEALFVRTKNRIKTALWKNGFYSKRGAELDKYKKETATRLIRKSRFTINEMGFDNLPYLKGTENTRFTEEEALSYWSDIVDEAIRIKNAEDEAIRGMFWILAPVFSAMIKTVSKLR